MKKSLRPPVYEMLVKLRNDLAEVSDQSSTLELSNSNRRALNLEIKKFAHDLSILQGSIDPVQRSQTIFDPGNPRTIGFFIALAMTAQPRLPLNELQDFYGSGVYAIYYKGDYELYVPLRNTETPIYIGQAAPSDQGAQTAIHQGLKLSGRLGEHRKNIERAAATLNIEDFEYRSLVVQTGWETGAENYLIRLFRPIWNSETKLVFGLGKHGDSAETRKNKRSPWDTLHTGRGWAVSENITDAKTPEKIAAELRIHFERNTPFATVNDVMKGFIEALRQT